MPSKFMVAWGIGCIALTDLTGIRPVQNIGKVMGETVAMGGVVLSLLEDRLNE